MRASTQRASRRQRERKVLLRALRELRIERGFTQHELALAIGSKQAFVSKYETGERRLDFIDLVAVCEALGVTITTFADKFERLRRALK